MTQVLVQCEDGLRKLVGTRRLNFPRPDGVVLRAKLKDLPGVKDVMHVVGQVNWGISLEMTTPHEYEAAVEEIRKCFWTHGVELKPARTA